MKKYSLLLIGFLLLCWLPVVAQTDSPYSNCGMPLPLDATFACRLYHPNAIGVVGTGYCVGEKCFEMSIGEVTRVVAADGLGDFPRTWFVWQTAGQVVDTYPGINCILQEQGKKKTRVDLPDGQFRCKTELPIGSYLYHEHFASNPPTGCLAWLECREDVP
jgi:hypothetical protein